MSANAPKSGGLPHVSLDYRYLNRAPRLITRSDWDATGESAWCVIHKLVYLNTLAPETVHKIFLSKEALSTFKRLKINRNNPELDIANPKNVDTDVLLANTNLTERSLPLAFDQCFDHASHGQLHFCPICIEAGFHSPIFELSDVRLCPWHGVELEDRCPSCGAPIYTNLPVSGVVKPFQCKCGHLLWPGISDESWVGGPVPVQREELFGVLELAQRADWCFESPTERVAYLTNGGQKPRGCTSVWNAVFEPLPVIRRAIGELHPVTRTLVSPVALDRDPHPNPKPTSIQKIGTMHLYDDDDCRSVLDSEEGQIFDQTALPDMVRELESFTRSLELTISEHHGECRLGMKTDVPGYWSAKDENVCVWKAAAMVMKASPIFGFRDYGETHLNVKTVRHRPVYLDLFKTWSVGARAFLTMTGDNIDTEANTAFCAWLASVWLKDHMVKLYLFSVDSVIESLEDGKVLKRLFTNWRRYAHGCVVQYDGNFPVVTFAASKHSEKSLFDTIARGQHDPKRIAKELLRRHRSI
ncbi:MAG: hypothetical protein AAFY44_17790 [Pseudomonadota bacterium]